LLTSLLAGCQPSDKAEVTCFVDAAAVNGELALGQVAKLVKIVPRDSGSDGCRRAAKHLLKSLQPYVDDAELDVFTNGTPRGELVFRNVVGSIPGTGKSVVLLISHYDTKSGICADFQGANDSGSSSGLLLELARVLHESQNKLPFTVVFAFLDGEESQQSYTVNDGLHGSRRMVEFLKERGLAGAVKAVILLDMVGDCDLNIEIPHNVDSRLRKIALAASRAAGVREKFSLSHSNVIDDHVPFIDAGMPALDLIDFDYGSKPGLNDYWHTPDDRMEHICAASLETVGKVVLYILNALGQ
jgi:Zn-dependent M28 family amino/carboxypeptidase